MKSSWRIALASILVIAGFPSTSHSVSSEDSSTVYVPLVQIPSAFALESQELIAMNQKELFARPEGRLVIFDSNTAKQQGFSEKSITLAGELTSFTNDLILGAEQADLDYSVVGKTYQKALTYVNMIQYFNEARDPNNWYKEDSDLGTLQKANTAQIPNPGKTIAAELVCGFWWNPQPSKAVEWTHNIPSSDPVADLTVKGYHAPPGWLEMIGWTRPQTYRQELCGTETFRDNGMIDGPQAIGLQEYEGITPRGEPNPEVWRSGPWPYPFWPAYVFWWHQTF